MRDGRRHHAQCLIILAESVGAARAALAAAPAREWDVQAARLRKLEELHAYASSLG